MRGGLFDRECLIESIRYYLCVTKQNGIFISILKNLTDACNIKCTADYKPICGSNGKTYANLCVMRAEACLQKKEITVAQEGECPSK